MGELCEYSDMIVGVITGVWYVLLCLGTGVNISWFWYTGDLNVNDIGPRGGTYLIQKVNSEDASKEEPGMGVVLTEISRPNFGIGTPYNRIIYRVVVKLRLWTGLQYCLIPCQKRGTPILTVFWKAPFFILGVYTSACYILNTILTFNLN